MTLPMTRYMLRVRLLLSMASFATSTADILPTKALDPRSVASLDFGWRFKAFPTLGPKYYNPQDYPASEWPHIAATDFDDSSWRMVNVPHDFVVEGGFNESVVPAHACGHCTGYQAPGVGWYRKTWEVPASEEGKSATLTFDGIYRNATVWLNNVQLGQHASGYTSFHFAVGHLLRAGQKNTLVVRADATLKEGWWYEGGGIYRHTWLTTYTRDTYIAPWGVRVTSAVKGEITRNETAQQVVVTVQVALGNDSPAPASVSVQTAIFDLQDHLLASGKSLTSVTVPPGSAPGNGTAAAWTTLTMSVEGMGLWSIENPRLYHCVTTLHDDSNVLDRLDVRFAPRVINVSAAGGLSLNGKHVKLSGVANHMDFAGLGNALPDRVQRFRVSEMKRMGVNAWRCAHNPPAPEFLDACDELGMLVLDEQRHFGIQPDSFILPLTCNDSKWSSEDHEFMDGLPCISDGVAAFEAENIADLKSMVLRDRNHPSIFAWSLCNEPECELHSSSAALSAGRLYKDIIAELDGTRPTTGAMIDFSWNGSAALGQLLDIQGFNYQDGAYDTFHSKHPTTPMLATETTNGLEDRGEYNDKSYMSSFDTSQEAWWSDQVGRGIPGWKKGEDLRRFMTGGFYWTGFEYKGECEWPSVSSHFGSLDHAGFWKDRAWWYAAVWKPSEPLLHVFPGWGKAGLQKSLVYTNADSVTCILVPTHSGPNISFPVVVVPALGHGVLVAPDNTSVPQSGTLHCTGYVNGSTAVHSTQSLQSVGTPASLQLSVEMQQTQLLADGQDVALLRLEVLDSSGVLVPYANNNVSFSVLSGPGAIIGVGNGDPHCLEPDKSTWRSAFHGLVRAIVQSQRPGDIGTVVVEAQAAGLTSSRVTLEAIVQ